MNTRLLPSVLKRKAVLVGMLVLIASAILLCVFLFGATGNTRALAEAQVSVTINAEGAESAAVKAKAEILDEDGKAVVEEREFDANTAVDVGELPEGTYSLNVVSAPVLDDGSTYRLPEEAVGFEVAGEDPVEVEATLERISADDMTKEQLEAVAQELDDAGQGEAASAARTKSETAASVAGSAGTVSRPSSSTGTSTTKPSTPSSSSGSSTSNSGSGSSGSSTSGGSSGGSSSSGGTQAHTHTWVPQTEQQWVSNNVWVVDQAAWDEQVTTYEWHEVCSCGYDCTANGVDPADHRKDHGRGWSGSTSTQQVPVTTTVHHDEVGHWEDQGYYQTMTTGYVCSGCGAVQ